MNKEAFFIGLPVEFKNLCLVYPPKVKDVVHNKYYATFQKMLTFSQEEIEDEYMKNGTDVKDVLTPFEYILNSAFHNKQFELLMKKAFEFFIHEPITPLYEQKMIIIGDIKEAKGVESLRILREEDYFMFQNFVRLSTGVAAIDPPDPNEHPRIREMKAKARYRDRVKAQSGKGLNMKTLLAVICCMNLGLNPLNIGELSYAAIPTLLAYYQEKEKYELDVDTLLAGADSKKVHPKYWIRNLED